MSITTVNRVPKYALLKYKHGALPPDYLVSYGLGKYIPTQLACAPVEDFVLHDVIMQAVDDKGHEKPVVEERVVKTRVFYCDSVSWDDSDISIYYDNKWYLDDDVNIVLKNKAQKCLDSRNTSGDGSVNNPWRNVTYALEQINCYLWQEHTLGANYNAEFTPCCATYVKLIIKGFVDYSVCLYTDAYNPVLRRNTLPTNRTRVTGYNRLILDFTGASLNMMPTFKDVSVHKNIRYARKCLWINSSYVYNADILINIGEFFEKNLSYDFKIFDSYPFTKWDSYAKICSCTFSFSGNATYTQYPYKHLSIALSSNSNVYLVNSKVKVDIEVNGTYCKVGVSLYEQAVNTSFDIDLVSNDIMYVYVNLPYLCSGCNVSVNSKRRRGNVSTSFPGELYDSNIILNNDSTSGNCYVGGVSAEDFGYDYNTYTSFTVSSFMMGSSATVSLNAYHVQTSIAGVFVNSKVDFSLSCWTPCFYTYQCNIDKLCTGVDYGGVSQHVSDSIICEGSTFKLEGGDYCEPISYSGSVPINYNPDHSCLDEED